MESYGSGSLILQTFSTTHFEEAGDMLRKLLYDMGCEVRGVVSIPGEIFLHLYENRGKQREYITHAIIPSKVEKDGSFLVLHYLTPEGFVLSVVGAEICGRELEKEIEAGMKIVEKT